MTAETIHTCSYSCERPGCIRAQRDELRVKLEALTAAQQQSAVVDEAMVERIAALLYEEAIDEPWTVAGVEHPGPDRDYYRRLARKVAALATQPPADDEVVFYDGVGAGRSSIKSCRDGVQWIRVGDRVYWPLSDSDAKRLQSACCGNGSFDGPASALPSAHSDDLPTLLDNLMRASFDDGDRGREKFSGATMAAREAVLAHVRDASAPPSAAAGVDWPIIVEGLRLADRFFDGDDRYWKPASTVRAAYLAALAAQQQGGRTDD